jgi:hypothetical protein
MTSELDSISNVSFEMPVTSQPIIKGAWERYMKTGQQSEQNIAVVSFVAVLVQS